MSRFLHWIHKHRAHVDIVKCTFSPLMDDGIHFSGFHPPNHRFLFLASKANMQRARLPDQEAPYRQQTAAIEHSYPPSVLERRRHTPFNYAGLVPLTSFYSSAFQPPTMEIKWISCEQWCSSSRKRIKAHKLTSRFGSGFRFVCPTQNDALFLLEYGHRREKQNNEITRNAISGKKAKDRVSTGWENERNTVEEGHPTVSEEFVVRNTVPRKLLKRRTL